MFFISEKLYNSTGRDLRRALFSLKQIFQVKTKQTNKKTKEYCQVLFLHCCGIRCRQVYAFYLLQKEKCFRVQSKFRSKYLLRVFLPYQIFQTIGSKENIIRITIFFHVYFRLKKNTCQSDKHKIPSLFKLNFPDNYKG